MRERFVRSLAFAVALSAFTPAGPALADITIIGKYRFADGDTATRTSYYSRKRVRVSAPDGKEFIHDTGAKRVTIIDHDQRRYFTGTIQEADSTAARILAQRRRELQPRLEANPELVAQVMQTFQDSASVVHTEEMRTIAGYPCSKWIMRAGSYMTHERWVARGLTVPNYGPELERVMMATVLDPLGRQLLKMMIQMRKHSGTVLASTTRFHTPDNEGEFSWEAVRVTSQPIPKTVWDLPADYVRANPPGPVQ